MRASRIERARSRIRRERFGRRWAVGPVHGPRRCSWTRPSSCRRRHREGLDPERTVGGGLHGLGRRHSLLHDGAHHRDGCAGVPRAISAHVSCMDRRLDVRRADAWASACCPSVAHLGVLAPSLAVVEDAKPCRAGPSQVGRAGLNPATSGLASREDAYDGTDDGRRATDDEWTVRNPTPQWIVAHSTDRELLERLGRLDQLARYPELPAAAISRRPAWTRPPREWRR